MGKTFAARFPSRCADCGGQVEPGDAVHYVGDYHRQRQLVHLTCPEVEDDPVMDELPGEMCPRCFCRHRGEC